MDDVETIQSQIRERDVDARCQAWSICSFHFEAQAPASADDEQIELRSVLRTPEVTLLPLSAQARDDLLQHEPLPRGSELGVDIEFGTSRDPQERVKQAAVCNVDAR